MTERIEVTLPKLGESILSATVVQWLKKEGDFVSRDEPLLEVATDKVNSEIPSPVAGYLREICVAVDQEIEVGALLARLEVAEKQPYVAQQAVPTSTPSCPHAQKGSAPVRDEFLSPAVLTLARREGLSLDQLNAITPTGEGGRLTKRDVEKFLEGATQVKAPIAAPAAPLIATEREERVVMSRRRKAIAENMVRSFYEAPHASLVTEVDVTDIMKVIAKEKERFFKAHGVKLTVTAFILQALTKSLEQYPMFNSSLEGETIVMKRYVNVGIAVNVEKGLVVPVIKNCQERGIVSLAKALADLAVRARSEKLTADEMAEGTITMTNFGMGGALIGVPIIRFPEVAIIGIGAIQKRVVVREDDSFSVRQMVYLTLTFDHRLVDGMYGCAFLESFKNQLESVVTGPEI